MRQAIIGVVTGGTGFIGSHLVDLLIERGHRVYVIDDLSTGSLENLNQQAEFEYHDISDRDWLCDFIRNTKPDWLFHLAALPRIQPSFDEPESHDDVNVRGTLNVVHAVRGATSLKAVVFSSSSAVYGNPAVVPTSESGPINPLSPYALQKYAAERYLHILGERYRLPVVSLRYFNVYGSRSFNLKNPFNAYSSVVGIFQNQKRAGKPLTITGDGKQKRDFVHVRDVARANVLVAERIDQSRGKVFNVGNGKSISVLDVARLFKHEYCFIPERAGEARIIHADVSRLMQLGWKPLGDLQEFIERGE